MALVEKLLLGETDSTQASGSVTPLDVEDVQENRNGDDIATAFRNGLIKSGLNVQE
jgi:hypothetical protein